MIFELHHKKTNILHYVKTKAQISFAVTAKLISAFVSLHGWYNPSTFLIRNFQPLAFFCGCVALFVSDHKFKEVKTIYTPLYLEPRREKTGLRGFPPGLTQTGLYSFRKSLED